MNAPLWRDIAVILLILELFILLIPFLLLFYFSIRAMARLQHSFHGLLTGIRKGMDSLSDSSKKASHTIASPVIKGHSLLARGRGIFQSTLSVMRGK